MRLAEVIGALSMAADVSSGLAMEKGLRTVLVAMRLARRLGASAEEQHAVFWVTALRFVGCTAFAPEEAAIAAGDDNSMRKTMVFVDFDQRLDALGRVVRGFAPEASVRARGRGGAHPARPELPPAYARPTVKAACSSRVAGHVGGGRAGAGHHRRALRRKGTAADGGRGLPLAARVSDVADPLELFAWTGGPDLARTVLRQRRGRTLDPALVDAALAELPELLQDLRPSSVWDQYLAAEPAPLRVAGTTSIAAAWRWGASAI